MNIIGFYLRNMTLKPQKIFRMRLKTSLEQEGNPYDNACIESLHSILKKEGIHLNKYSDFEMAGKSIYEYIESWYNRKRIHSSLNYITPQAFEDAVKVAA